MLQVYILILSFIVIPLQAQKIDANPHTIYFKMSPNEKFKAAFTYDNHKEWYAFTVYEVKNKEENLISIGRINDSFIENVIFKFTKDSNYLFYATQSHQQYVLYNLQDRLSFECYGLLDFAKTEKKLIKDCKNDSIYDEHILYNDLMSYKDKQREEDKALENTHLKLIYDTWSEFYKLKSNNQEKMKESLLLEKALAIAFNKQIHTFNTANFIYYKNTLEVYINDIGAYAFTADATPNIVAKRYTLKNARFKIKENTIELIAGDLYPQEEGEIFSIQNFGY